MPDVSQTARPSLAARRRARRRRIVVLATAGAVVLVAAGGGVALAVTGGDGARYRTVAAEKASVEQLIDSVGTIASATRRDASFSVAGTVANVNVNVGQVVAAGDTLATLDTEALQDDVERAQADLATAQQQLSDDLASQTSSDSTPSSSSSTPSSSSSTPAPEPSAPTPEPSATTPSTDEQGDGGDTTDPAVAQAVHDVQDAQQALLDQYEIAADALAASGDSVTASQASCAAFLAVVPADVTGPEDDPTDPADLEDPEDPTPTDAATPDTTAVAQALADCQAALSGALDAQTATDVQQQALLTLAGALDGAVAALQAAIEQSASPNDPTPPTNPTTPTDDSSTPPAAPTTPSDDSSTPSSPTSPSGDDSAQVASAATILADQAAIALAEANVTLAQSRLPFATLTSPIAGTVAAVAMRAGDAVTATSTTAVVTVIGTNGYTVTTTVPLTSIDIVQLGQTAALTTPSTDTALTGTVASIGILDASSTSEPAYTVVLAVDPTEVQLYDGASATVRISVAGADEVLTVPTSAVHVDGATATVQVLENGIPTDVTVTVGAVGAERTEITEGLALGQEVVLADLDQAIDTGTSSNDGLSGLGDEDEGPQTFVFEGGVGGPPPGGFTGGGPERG